VVGAVICAAALLLHGHFALARGPELPSRLSDEDFWNLSTESSEQVREECTRRGIDFLLNHPRRDGQWEEPWYTAVGFPRVFYLRYHGYCHYFPLWALARYRGLRRSNTKQVMYGL